LGSTSFEEAQVDSWNAFTATGIWNNTKKVGQTAFGHAAYNKNKFDQAVKGLKDQAAIVNKHLTNKAWLVGETLTVADVFLFVAFMVPL